jgi:predicted MFS family arabinose efflux permease
MRLKSYVIWIILATILAFASFVAIIWFFSPEHSSPAILTLFFLSLFLSLCGLFSLIALYFRKRRQNTEIMALMGISFREGTLLSGLLIGMLLMQYYNIFYWWLALIFLIIVIAIEMAFASQENKHVQGN